MTIFSNLSVITFELYYYRDRYYDASIQRFISLDPIGFLSGDFNFYRYTSNNDPLNFTDPSGFTVIIPEQVGDAPIEVVPEKIIYEDGRIGSMQKQKVYSYNFNFYDYPSMSAYDKAVNNGTVTESYGTMENMTFTIGATSKHRYKVEGGTNISQGNKDKTYKIQKGYGQYDVRINDMNGNPI